MFRSVNIVSSDYSFEAFIFRIIYVQATVAAVWSDASVESESNHFWPVFWNYQVYLHMHQREFRPKIFVLVMVCWKFGNWKVWNWRIWHFEGRFSRSYCNDWCKQAWFKFSEIRDDTNTVSICEKIAGFETGYYFPVRVDCLSRNYVKDRNFWCLFAS